MSWEPVVATLEPPRHADDISRQMAKLQLMMGGQISRTTGLASVPLLTISCARYRPASSGATPPC
ncbi:MAG: hypothetical protein HC807_04250 [Gammaproteobacteria bacterium]|nr:hypothetical protein [Gammaproteobacteria bacterium]